MNKFTKVKASCITIMMLATQLCVTAQDGKTLYGQFCASCHGPDGKGVGGGAFPPLLNSEWIKGNNGTGRIAQIIEHGITGPVEVKGKVYNLAMPAQGSLSVEQKVAVIGYVKKAFAKEPIEFGINDFKELQKKSANREEAWTADELLKIYPFPKKKSAIKNLILTEYHGNWESMPDFDKLEAAAVEEENHGFISLKSITKTDHYAIVWEGDLQVPENGQYTFEVMADDAATIFINGKQVAKLTGQGALSPKRKGKGKIKLSKGSHKIAVHYLEINQNQGIVVKMINQKKKKTIWLTAPSKKLEVKAPVIDISPKGEETVLYQNYIQGASLRTLAVGYPHQQNIAFSLEDCQPDLIWKGKFINAGQQWTERSKGVLPPISKQLVALGRGPAWAVDGKPIDVKLIGYKLDENGQPTFSYKPTGKNAELGLVFTERYVPSENSLAREVTVESDQDRTVTLRLLSKAKEVNAGVATQGDLNITTSETTNKKGNFITTLNLKKGTNTQTITYSWTK